MIEATDQEESLSDILAWESHVRQAASMVESGAITIDDVEAHEYHGKTDEEAREAVRDRLDDGQVVTETETTDEGDEITQTDAIDWRALFEEFGLHTPNAAGSLHVSETKLTEAVRVSKQNIAGNPHNHIKTAVENGTLIEETTTAAKAGTEVTAGYRLGGQLA